MLLSKTYIDAKNQFRIILNKKKRMLKIVLNVPELYFCLEILKFYIFITKSPNVFGINKDKPMVIYKYLRINILSILLLVLGANTMMAQVSADAGKDLFKNYCASCHNKDMRSGATGPALGGVEALWGDDVALYAWIRNSQDMIKKGHPRAVEVWNQYKPTIMTAFPDLTDDQIGSIMAYVNGVYDGTYGAKPGAAVAASGDNAPASSGSNMPIYLLIVAVLAVLVVVLAKIITNLNVIAAATEGKTVEAKSVKQILTSKGVVSFLIFAAIILGAYTTVKKSTELGRQEGYAPEQPIKFSHETHAGLHKIDCQFCHDGARRSKHSVIPSTNTCMNCHAAIKNGSKYGTAEISKIYASIGFDPNSGKYIEDYESKTEEEIRAIFTKWIGDQYKEEKELADLDSDGERIVAEQWVGIKKSLTNDLKKQIQGPIEWVRIHALPDHVYFNHSQHVTVGKLECQTCHGQVEKMEVMTQMSPLSMGWCVNCHRQTEVKFKDNEYYANYTRYHEEIASGKRDKVTVADIGGLECQKCHY